MKNGASEGIRTLDIHVGNVTLYQTELRSLPRRLKKTTGIPLKCKSRFLVGHARGAFGHCPGARTVPSAACW